MDNTASGAPAPSTGAPELTRRITASLDRGVRSGKSSAEERDAALGRLRVTADLDDIVVRQDTILTSNTSLVTDMLGKQVIRSDDRAGLDTLKAIADSMY